jgi:RNA polymerase II subunit A-like phosphatase
MTPALKKKHTTKTEEMRQNQPRNGETTTWDTGASKTVDQEKPEEAPEADGARISALEELVRMGGGDDQALRLEQAAEQEKFLEKQLTERPLCCICKRSLTGRRRRGCCY